MALFRAQGRVSDFSNSRMKDSWVLLCTIQCAPQRGDKPLLVVLRHTAFLPLSPSVMLDVKQRGPEYFIFSPK